MIKKVTLISLILLVGWNFVAAQIVQWRGPDRDGLYPDTGLMKEWPSGGPDLVLKKEGLGKGYSTPVLYEGHIYISGKKDSLDAVTKLDMEGNILWETVIDDVWEDSFPETKNTPTIENGKLYIMGGMGNVVCISTESGEVIWSVNTHEKFDAEFHAWGMAESLLLTDQAVISTPIGERTMVVALDKENGSTLWESKSLGGERSYVSPLMINHNGREIILAVSHQFLLGVDPVSGEILFSFDVATGHSEEDERINTVTPLYHNGSVFVNSGYDADAIMLSLNENGTEAKLKWSEATLDTHLGGMVLLDGYIYGSNWINNAKGNWVCQEWESGKVMYEEKWNNKGSVIYADGLLYVYEEKRGTVGLVEPTPEGFKVISSFRVNGGSGPYWAHMSIYDKKLLIRHGEVLFVYDIADKD